MALRTLREAPSDAGPSPRRLAVGGALLWAGTVAYGGSTVALIAVLSRHSSRTGFSAVAALLGLSFVVSLIPSGITLRSASLVADGRPPPALTVRSGCLIAAVSFAVSPLLALLLHVSVLAAAIVTIQMLVAIPLAIRQGALLGRHRFDAIGTNLVIEGIARFVLGALAGIALGVTGLAVGLCAGTVVALFVAPKWRSDVKLVDRPRTSLTATSASLALLGLFVQLDVLIAPSVVERGGATAYDLAAVPSKGVYLALLAIGPLIFPSVRGRPDRGFVLRATSVSLAFGVACTVILVVFRDLIGSVLGRPAADPLELALLGLAMALAGATGIVISAGIAQGLKHPWPPLALGIVVLLACWPLHPGGLALSVVVVTSQAVAMVLCLANCMRKISQVPQGAEDVMELLAEAGDPLVPAQARGRLPESGAEAAATGNFPQTAPRRRDGGIAVIIPTFRRPQLLRRLVDSLTTSQVLPEEIIVVDNDPEGSVDPADLPADVQVLHAGFGINVNAARNAGWRASRSDVCLFIDDDNEVQDRCLGALAVACRDESVGVAGPVIYSGDEGKICCAGTTLSRWTGMTRCIGFGQSEPPNTRPRWPTSGVPDAYALRRDVLEQLGGFDDVAFPMCGEEFDLGERVSALGLDRIVVREARIRHYGNVSENHGEHMVRNMLQHGPQRVRLMARSRVRVHRRYANGLARYTTLLLFVPLWALASAVACLRVKAPLGARLQAVKAIVAGLAEGYRVAPSS
jgi:GT2 family glycosyltransferase